MKWIKVNCVLLLFVSFIALLPITMHAEGDSGTKTEVRLKKNQKPDVVKPEPDTNGPIYKPVEAKPVNLLPHTGEILTSFMYIIIGLSVLLFILGLIINKTAKSEVRWEY